MQHNSLLVVSGIGVTECNSKTTSKLIVRCPLLRPVESGDPKIPIEGSG